MKKRKIFLIYLLTVLAIFCFAFATACNKDDSPKQETPDISEESLIILKYREIQVKLYEQFKFDVDSNLPVKFSIEDESIATIDDSGIITAYKVGSTIVCVSNGITSENVIINVYSDGNVAYISSNAGDEITIAVDKKFILSNKLMYSNTEYVTDFSYLSYDESVAIVDSNGVITGVSSGTTGICISGSIYTQTVKKLIRVNVVSDVNILIDKNGYTLETRDSDSFVQLPNSVYEQDVEVTENISYSFDEEVLQQQENGKFTLKKPLNGVEQTTVKISYTASDNSVNAWNVPITIHYESVDKTDYSIVVENCKNNQISGHPLSYEKHYGDGDIIKIIEDGVDLLYDKETGLFGCETSNGEKEWKIYNTDGNIYRISVEIVDIIVDSAEDFDVFSFVTNEKIVFTKDIIYNEDAFATGANAYIGSQEGSSYKMAASDYAGTLDGRGHTIYGFKVSNNNRGGLFYSVSKTGTVKNINFVDANLSSNYQYTNLIAYDTYGTVENVYASVKTTERTINFGVITNYVRNTCKLKDIVVNLDYTGDESRAGAITYSVVGSVATENCYVLSNLSKVSCKYNSGAPGAANETETAGAERLTGVVRIATEEELIEKANSGEFTDSINGVIKNGELEVVVDVTSGKLYGATIAGETITGVKSGETDLGYNGTENKIAVNGEESGESKVLTIETDKWTYTVTALYANVVSNPTEFLGISQYAKGYIVLTEDIKFTSGEKYTMGEVITGSITLDGKGHTVEGLDLSSSSQNSLFNISQSRTTETVTIKDISFTGVNLKESSGSNRVNLISRYPMIAVKMENLFVQVSSMTGGMGVLFDMFADKKVELKNTAIIGTATSYVVRTANSTPKAHTAEGSYFIGKAVNAGTFGSGGSFEKVNVLSAEANLYELIDNSTTTDTSGETVTWEGAETLKTLIQAYRAKTTA